MIVSNWAVAHTAHKCDGEFPCKRCKDDGLICTAGVRKKVEYKQLPRGYALGLPPSHLTTTLTLIAGTLRSLRAHNSL